MNYIIFIVVCAAIGVGNYYVYLYVGMWTYIIISLSCGVFWMLMVRHYLRRKDHERQLILARYAVKTEDTITDIRKKGF